MNANAREAFEAWAQTTNICLTIGPDGKFYPEAETLFAAFEGGWNAAANAIIGLISVYPANPADWKIKTAFTIR